MIYVSYVINFTVILQFTIPVMCVSFFISFYGNESNKTVGM